MVFNFVLGLHPHPENLSLKEYDPPPILNQKKEKIGTIIVRAFLVFIGLGVLCFVAEPSIYDAFQFTRQGSTYANHIRGRVARNDTIFALYFIHQGLLIKKDEQKTGSLYSAVFFPRVAHFGKTYDFTIAPKSGLILDFTEVTSGKE